MKTEIEHLQHLLEKAKVKLMKDFELWWAQQTTAINVRTNLILNCVLSQQIYDGICIVCKICVCGQFVLQR